MNGNMKRTLCVACNGTGYFEASETQRRYGDEDANDFFMADRFDTESIGAELLFADASAAAPAAAPIRRNLHRNRFTAPPPVLLPNTAVYSIASHVMSLDEMLAANKRIRYQGVSAFPV